MNSEEEMTKGNQEDVMEIVSLDIVILILGRMIKTQTLLRWMRMGKYTAYPSNNS